MTTPASGLTATGLAVTMISVGAGVSSGGTLLVLLLSFAGVLAGSTLIFVGVRVADDPTAASISRPGVLSVSDGIRALVHYMGRNLAVVGLLLVSVAVTVTAAATTSGTETGPMLCFSAFVLFLLGLSLLNVGVVLLGKQKQ